MEKTTFSNTFAETLVKTENDVQSGFSWEKICSDLNEAFHLSEEEMRRLYNSRPAQLIAALPYTAGCSEAERTAFGHLCLYIAEIRNADGPGRHCMEDNKSVFSRLRMLASFNDGDTDVIRHGMELLALVMLCGYNRTREADAEKSVYNPLNDGSWNFDEMKNSLLDNILTHPCARLDTILSADSALYGVWC